MLGRNRYFVKKEIVWQIPLFGWAFWALGSGISARMGRYSDGLGMILVSRNWTNDASTIEYAQA
jgi:1-acyl-sn-glycerol-3-phosphate acyltransferase